MSQNPYSASGEGPGASDPAGTDPAAYPPGAGAGSANPAGGSHAAGSAEGAPSSYPSGNEPSQPTSTGSADPYGQPGGGHGQPGGGYGDSAYGGQAPYGQPTPPPYGQQPPQQGYGDPNASYPQSYGTQPPPAGQQGYGDQGQQGYPPQQYGQSGYPQQQQPYGAAGQGPVSDSDEKTWGIISHISIPFFWFVGPLIGYLMYKDRSPFLKQVTTEALNFSILYSIVQVAGWVLSYITFGLVNLAAFIVALIFCIMATMAASRHEFYKYPINARFIK